MAPTAQIPVSKIQSSQLAAEFLDYVHASPSPFHAVDGAKKLLVAGGFTEVRERDAWAGKLRPGGKFFFTRNHSSICAFALPSHYDPSRPSFAIYGAHTDSPCLKLKPNSKREKAGYLQLGVQVYGGGLWHTWFDRDLGVAGRVLVESGGKVENKLVWIDRPVLRIPTLAIHLDRSVNDGFIFNKEVQLTPVVCSTEAGKAASSSTAAPAESKEDDPPAYASTHKLVADLIAEAAGVGVSQLRDLELCLHDVQPPTVGGAKGEYVFSARLDNLMMSWCGLKALILSTSSPSFATASSAAVVSLFDNEEVGSTSAYGADSHFMESTLRRIVAAGTQGGTIFEEAIHRSFLISADMAHAVHPNYSEKHEEGHRPKLNGGPVIKSNANQRYATTAVTAAVIRRLARAVSVPVQDFVVRNDSPCGSTIGPCLSSKLGLRTVDIGNPQLSMHSIREMAGVEDVGHAVALVQGFFCGWDAVDAELEGAAL